MAPNNDDKLESSQRIISIYRRKLPNHLISFTSSYGRDIFYQALKTGHMNCYFYLATTFSTQNEPNSCGIATLSMVLNALGVDPGRIWIGVWRWYHEDLLSDYSLGNIPELNTIDDFESLSHKHQCKTMKHHVVKTNSDFKYYMNILKQVTLKNDSIMVCSYSRKSLGLYGDGHFSVVGGYDPNNNLVLLMDVSRFEYPSHWVDVDLLWEAMTNRDKLTGLTRGFCILQKRQPDEELIVTDMPK